MLSTAILIIAGMMACVGLFHLPMFLRDRSRYDHLFFILFCFLSTVYSIFFFSPSQVMSVRVGEWRQVPDILLSLALLAFLWFGLCSLKQKPSRPAWVLTFLYGLYCILAFALKAVPAGMGSRLHEGLTGICAWLLYMLHGALFVFLFRIMVRKWGDDKSETLPLMVSAVMLAAAYINDILIRSGLSDLPSLAGIALMASVLLPGAARCMAATGSVLVLRKMEESEERYRAIFENRGVATGIVDRESTILLCNGRFEELSGYARREIEGKMKWTDFVSGEDVERLRSERTFLQDGSVFQFECRMKSRAGDSRFIQVNSSYMHGRGLYIVSLNDITEKRTAQMMLLQKNAELEAANEELEANNEQLMSAYEELQDGESKFRAIFNNSYHLSRLLSLEGKIIAINETALKFYGLGEKDVLGRYFWEVFRWSASDEDRGQLKGAVDRAAGGETVRFEMNRSDEAGNPRIFDFIIRPIVSPTGKFLYLIAESLDITERKNFEEQIRRQNENLTLAKISLEAAVREQQATSEEFEAQNEELTAAYCELENREKQYRDIFNAVSDSLFIVDDTGRIAMANSSACAVYGYTEEELKGMEISRLVHTDYRHMFTEFMESMGRNETYQGNAMDIRKDGTAFYTEVKASWIEYRGKPHILSVVRDISERKRAQDLLVQSEKMMTVGGLAAGMAHEINNPLSVIIQGVQATMNRISPDTEKNRQAAARAGIDLHNLQRYLDERNISVYFKGMLEAAARAAKIVSSMINFSRGSTTRISVSLHGVIDESITMAEKDYSFEKKYDFRHITIVRDYDEKIGDIACVPEELEQVFFNILKNSAEAMTEKKSEGYMPEIHVTTRMDGDNAVITFGDNGPGMDEVVRKRVFEPFFTTKSPGSGTGLGLSVSYFIITSNHGGTIEVDSESGKGTVFTIKLPLGAG